MKKIYLLFISLFFVTTLVLAQDAATNWTGDVDIDIFKEATAPHGGVNCARISVKTGTQANCDFTNETLIPVTAGSTITVKFWYKTSIGVKARCAIAWSDATNFYSTAYGTEGTSAWTEFSEETTVPTGVTTAKISIRFYDVTGFVAPESEYIDNITVESPTGTPLSVTNGDLETWTVVNSIQKEEKNDLIYPNPTSNILNLNNLQNANIKIFDLCGKMLMNINNTDSKIDVSNLNNGIYLIKIETQSGIITKKFIKE